MFGQWKTSVITIMIFLFSAFSCRSFLSIVRTWIVSYSSSWISVPWFELALIIVLIFKTVYLKSRIHISNYSTALPSKSRVTCQNYFILKNIHSLFLSHFLALKKQNIHFDIWFFFDQIITTTPIFFNKVKGNLTCRGCEEI